MTDTKLQELIETLRKQGVESAEQEGRRIIQNAKREAEEIKAKAQAEADAIVTAARSEADKNFRQLQSSMEIAASQLITDLKRVIEENLLALPLKDKISAELSDTKFLRELLTTCVKEYVMRPEGADLDVIVSKEQMERLAGFSAELAKSLPGKSEGDRVRVDLTSDGVSFGFIIGTRDGVVKLDFTHEAFLELFLKYLSPRFRSYFKEVDIKGLGAK